MAIIYTPPETFFMESAAHSASWRMSELHWHEVYELYVLEKGSNNMLVDGQILSVMPSDIVIISPGALHRSCGSSAHARTIMYFSRAYLECFLTPEGADRLLKCAERLIITPCAPAHRRIAENVNALRIQSVENADNNIFMLLSEILIILSMADGNEQRKLPTALNKSLGAILDYINANCCRIECIGEIAKEFFITEQYLCKIFKEGTGVTLTRYINSLKVQRACSLLRTTKKSVTQVGLESGFNSAMYFSKIFKETVNATPSEFRKGNV